MTRPPGAPTVSAHALVAMYTSFVAHAVRSVATVDNVM
jgi:hypothetical protein